MDASALSHASGERLAVVVRLDEMNITLAAITNDFAVISELLTNGANVDERDRDGRTPLMQATINGRIDIMKLFLDSGANPNAQDKGGWSALHFAAHEESAEGVELLVSHGASVDIADAHGNTPLFRAVFCYRGRGETIVTLLHLGADMHHENGQGVSPSSLAHKVANYDVRKFF